MSFDLYFYWRRPERINFEKVRAWAEGTGYFIVDGYQLRYRNDKTGVEFSFCFEVDPRKPFESRTVPIPDGYFDSGLSFRLDYNWPTYFGLESMPFVEDLACRFALTVENPQESVDPSGSGHYDRAETLTRSWIQHNKRAIVTMKNEFVRPVMTPAASLYLWRYARAEEDLQRTCGEEVCVPYFGPVRRQGETRAGRAMDYEEGLPFIIPKCEWIFIFRARKGFDPMQQEAAVISAEAFRVTLANYLKPFKWQGPHVKIIDPEHAKQAGKKLRTVERTLPSSEFDLLEDGCYVDIEIPALV